jgi:1-acyl-sn-glycerol-3-phosphate acyltransferase
MTPTAPSPLGEIARFFFGLYAWAVFAVTVLLAVFGTLLIPGLERRRRWVTHCARIPFMMTGMSVSVRGLEKLPAGDCVVVANHASYVDGVLLQGYLPPRFSYVIKGEMGRIPVVSYLLRRIGARFVERFDASGSRRDARRLVKAASAGESLAVFPEGTFIAEPGLGAFRPGAFTAAIRGSLPVVPVVIRGARRILTAGKLLPRHGHLAIDILDPISGDDPAWGDSRRVADLARQRMLLVLDEPDLLADEQN